MRTDDFLADLERQIGSRPPRPRRRPPAAALLVPAALVILALALFAGTPDPEREARPAASGERVTLRNGTGDPAVGRQARERLEAAGYRVTVTEADAADSAIFGAGPEDERRIGELLGAEGLGGWTGYAPDASAGPVITVILGKNQFGGGLEPITLLDFSGEPSREPAARRRLESAGVLVGRGGGPFPPRDTAVLAVAEDDAPLAAEVRRVLGLPPAETEYATEELLREYVGEPPGSVVVIVGPDYAP